MFYFWQEIFLKMTKHIFFFLLIILSVSAINHSCSTQRIDSKVTENNKSMISSPPVIVYKTRNNYFDKVPVTLSDDKQRILSYPAQSDIMLAGKFVFPTQLDDGYLLDNRGISPNSAFLRFSYQDYYNMDNIPDARRLMNYILDDNPFIEFYQVGRRNDFQDIKSQINQMITEKKLQKFDNLAR
jgi:hypothetical protein